MSDGTTGQGCHRRRGRHAWRRRAPWAADLHIHTLASDGTAGIEAILEHVERATDLDVIAITDHERIDAALAARSMARDLGLRAEVVVGEEVTTLGGHLLALFLDRPIRPYRTLRTTILAVHEQGGLAIPAHPLVPYPLCAQGWMLRRLLDDPDPAAHPDALETFNPTSLGKPWHRRVVRFADQHGLARVGNSDAHALSAIATGWTTFPGHDAADLRRAIETRDHRPRWRLPRDRRSARAPSGSSSGSAAATSATRSPVGSGGTGPGATTATRAAGLGRPRFDAGDRGAP